MSLNQYALNLAFTKAELKVIHDSLIHNLTMLEAFSILENDDKEIDTKETRLMNSILKKISGANFGKRTKKN